MFSLTDPQCFYLFLTTYSTHSYHWLYYCQGTKKWKKPHGSLVDFNFKLTIHQQDVNITGPISDRSRPKHSQLVMYVDIKQPKQLHLVEIERKEMFYLMTHSTHIIYGYMVSDIWLRTILIVRKETCCCHMGYSFRLAARVLLYALSHRQDNTYTAFITPVVEHWLSWNKTWPWPRNHWANGVCWYKGINNICQHISYC